MFFSFFSCCISAYCLYRKHHPEGFTKKNFTIVSFCLIVHFIGNLGRIFWCTIDPWWSTMIMGRLFSGLLMLFNICIEIGVTMMIVYLFLKATYSINFSIVAMTRIKW